MVFSTKTVSVDLKTPPTIVTLDFETLEGADAKGVDDIAGSTGKGGYPSRRSLPQFMEKQQQSQWCWIATATSVGNYYHGRGQYTQCRVATASLSNKVDCCANGLACNVPGHFNVALQNTRSANGMISGMVDFRMVVGQVGVYGHPIGARIAWNSGNGAHMIMITGYFTSQPVQGWRADTSGAGQGGNGVPYVEIQDCWYGSSRIRFSTLLNGYRGAGTWTHSYYTRRN